MSVAQDRWWNACKRPPTSFRRNALILWPIRIDNINLTALYEGISVYYTHVITVATLSTLSEQALVPNYLNW